MNTNSCKYHPLETANYFCEHCQINLCNTCTNEDPITQNNNAQRQCLFCDSALDELEHTSDIEPFWQNLKAVYLYPISISGITIMTIIALITAMAQNSLIALLLSPLLLLYYCNLCLEKTAHGKMTPPDFDEFFEINSTSFIGIFIVVILITIFVSMLASFFGEILAGIVLLFFIIAFPASIMTVAIDKNLSNAINPVELISIVKSTGKSYLMMCVFSLIMASSLALTEGMFISESPSFMTFFITSLISCYYTVIIFHIMGYIVYQNRRNLNFSIKDKKSETQIRSPKKRQQDHIETYIKAGYFAKAGQLSLKSIEEKDASLWELKRCFTLMLIRRDEKKVSEFLNTFFDQLYNKNQLDLMAESYIKATKRLPDYRPKNHTVWLSIGQTLLDIGHYKTSVSLLKNFHKISKDKSHISQSYDLLSQGLSKIPGYEKKAVQFKKIADAINSE